MTLYETFDFHCHFFIFDISMNQWLLSVLPKRIFYFPKLNIKFDFPSDYMGVEVVKWLNAWFAAHETKAQFLASPL